MTGEEQYKFIIVLGHESSGTRLIANTIARATGYDYDDGENRANERGELVDTFLTKTVHHWWMHPEAIRCDHDRITRRSLPHGGQDNTELRLNVSGEPTERAFFDPRPLIDGLKRAGYDVRVVLTVRDRSVAINSKCREHTGGDRALAGAEMDRAVAIMQSVLDHHDQCFVCSYEALMTLGMPYVRELYAFLGVDSDHRPELRDGNPKYIPEYTGAGGTLRAGSMFAFKLGMVTRKDEHQWGGDLRALGAAKDGLEQLGVDVQMARSAEELTDCDFVFLSNTCIDQRPNAETLIAHGVPYGLFGFHEDFQTYYPQSMGFVEYAAFCLQGHEENGVKYEIEALWDNPAVFNALNHPVPDNIQNNIPVMEHAAVCVASSHREARTMQRDCPPCKTGVVLWDVPTLGQTDDYADEFLQLTGLAKGEYILQVGRLETRKNQLATAIATADIDVPLVFIATKGYQDWYDLLVVNAGAKYRKAPTLLISQEYHSQLIGGEMRILQMPGGERLSERCLLSAYQNCGLHVHPAFWEAPGYTYLEAARLNVPTVASEWGTIQDYCLAGTDDETMDGRLTYVCPYNLRQIEQAVRENFGRQLDNGYHHPIFDRTPRDVGRDLLRCLIDHAS